MIFDGSSRGLSQMNGFSAIACSVPPRAYRSVPGRRYKNSTGPRAALSPGDSHLLVLPPRCAGVMGDLPAPGERVRPDVGEAPAQLRVVLVAHEHDLAVDGPADEAADAAVDRVDPGRAPRSDRSVIEADRRAMEGERRHARARLSATRDDPDVLHGAAAEHPAEVQLAAGGVGLPFGVEPRPGDVPRPDELAEQLQLLRIGAGRARDMQCFDKAVVSHRRPPG